MSVCNILVEPTRILLASDTCQYDGRRVVGYTKPKVKIAACGAFAFSVRGAVIFGQYIEETIGDAACLEDAKNLLEGGEHVIPENWFAAHPSFEITLAGVGRDGVLVAYQQVTHLQDINNGTVLPYRRVHGCELHPSVGELPRVPTEAQFLKLARAQFNIQDACKVPLCVGGVLHLTEVTPEGVTQRIAGLYGDYERGAEVFRSQRG